MVLCLGRIQNPDRGNGPCPGRILNITLPGSPGIAVRTIMKATIEIKTASHVMRLWKYKPLNQDAL
jgi:hypothetical protein